jgi:hypothetical protein
MDVEIHYGDAFGAMGGAGMERRDRHRIEQAEAHGACRLGVMAWGAHGAEGVVGMPSHDLVDGVNGGTDRA